MGKSIPIKSLKPTGGGKKPRYVERTGDALRQARLIAGANMIEALLHVTDAKAAREAAEALRAAGIPKNGELGEIPGFSIGGTGGDRRIGGKPGPQQTGVGTGDTGFKDPLAGLGNQRHRSVVVGPGRMPGGRDLASDGSDGGFGTDGGTSYTSGAQSSHGYVWAERNTERTSRDGMRTWGSTMYRDYSGNHYRMDYTETRTEDGGLRGKETVFDSHNEPVSTTVRESLPDGMAKETVTDHATGESTTRVAPMPEVFPDRYQDEGATSGGNNVAPRGWYNPITGQSQNAGIKTGNNQVNPGPEGESSPTMATPLRLDPKGLVINPLPDSMQTKGTPKPIQARKPDQIDPPRPSL